jgi:uncharacterized protein (TIGR02646 family)
MIPVSCKPEPPHFNKLVRVPGNNFLRTTQRPTKKQWKRNDYWSLISDNLYKAYNGICAYVSIWIPKVTGSRSVEHFVPKSVRPDLAYEWSNYRLVCSLMNGRKDNHQDVLDPFTLAPNWFILDFPSLIVKSNHDLNPTDEQRVNATINRLKLNDDECIEARSHWLKEYCRNRDLQFLQNYAPFIAYELVRQGITDSIDRLMSYS